MKTHGYIADLVPDDGWWKIRNGNQKLPSNYSGLMAALKELYPPALTIPNFLSLMRDSLSTPDSHEFAKPPFEQVISTS